jgi:hypothetical protein
VITEKHTRVLESIADGRMRVKDLPQVDCPEGWRVQLAVTLHGMGGIPAGENGGEQQKRERS